MAYNTIPSNPSEISCCSEKSDGESSCHEDDEMNDHKNCEKDCATHDCCAHSSILKNFIQIGFNSNSSEINVITEKIKNEFYNSVHLKDLSYSFWHPPKSFV